MRVKSFLTTILTTSILAMSLPATPAAAQNDYVHDFYFAQDEVEMCEGEKYYLEYYLNEYAFNGSISIKSSNPEVVRIASPTKEGCTLIAGSVRGASTTRKQAVTENELDTGLQEYVSEETLTDLNDSEEDPEYSSSPEEGDNGAEEGVINLGSSKATVTAYYGKTVLDSVTVSVSSKTESSEPTPTPTSSTVPTPSKAPAPTPSKAPTPAPTSAPSAEPDAETKRLYAMYKDTFILKSGTTSIEIPVGSTSKSTTITFGQNDSMDAENLIIKSDNANVKLSNKTNKSVVATCSKACTAKLTFQCKLNGFVFGLGTRTLKVTNATLKAPTAVKGLTLANSAAKTLKVSWTPAKDVTGYTIAYATSKTGTYKTKKVAGATKKTVNITGLTKGKTYYVKIRAYVTKNSVTKNGSYSSIKSLKLTK